MTQYISVLIISKYLPHQEQSATTKLPYHSKIGTYVLELPILYIQVEALRECSTVWPSYNNGNRN